MLLRGGSLAIERTTRFPVGVLVEFLGGGLGRERELLAVDGDGNCKGNVRRCGNCIRITWGGRSWEGKGRLLLLHRVADGLGGAGPLHTRWQAHPNLLPGHGTVRDRHLKFPPIAELQVDDTTGGRQGLREGDLDHVVLHRRGCLLWRLLLLRGLLRRRWQHLVTWLLLRLLLRSGKIHSSCADHVLEMGDPDVASLDIRSFQVKDSRSLAVHHLELAAITRLVDITHQRALPQMNHPLVLAALVVVQGAVLM
mmetsp:Transcript_27196/g.79258  ORF Transcript_27196/g.79258 Transcript_27196/m.79258 type:complete len:253 (-) Transcript_27196:319-1077(-)